jgi:hypothetical protein
MADVLVINAVGLTARLLPRCPRLAALAQATGCRRVRDTLPSVTCTAQATILTGKSPQEHGIVGNGWFFQDTSEIRFWQQSNRLLQAEPLYETLKKHDASFRVAKLFWWFNQGAMVDWAVTPKPHYGIDGGKVFGITGQPAGYTESLEKTLGPFPFHTFWGPRAGLPCTQWIARAAAKTILDHRPNLTLVYLPHLDYDPQRHGPAGCDERPWRELDAACEPLLDAAQKQNIRVVVLSEYGHCDVSTPIYLNRVLREAGLLQVRMGPYGEQLDTYASRAFAVCDHQLAHVYVQDAVDIPAVVALCEKTTGVAQVVHGRGRAAWELDHPRAGEIICQSGPTAWFAYPFWLDDRNAPDYARCVAIHHKPGYDPAELMMDPAIRFPMLKVLTKLARKKLGFRMKMDVVPLQAEIIRGSHGLMAGHPDDGPLLIGCGQGEGVIPMTAVRSHLEQIIAGA